MLGPRVQFLEFSLNWEYYVITYISCHVRVRLAEFTVANHDLETEMCRYTNILVKERFCKLYLTLIANEIEEEYHALLK